MNVSELERRTELAAAGEGTVADTPYILIGNAGNRRTDGLQAARRRFGLAPALLLTYQELLQGSASLEELLDRLSRSGAGSPIIRLDAPGEHPAVERELIALGALNGSADEQGARAQESIPAQAARRLPEEHGRIRYPAQWFRGYCRLLARLRLQALSAGIPVRWVNDPADIAVMFDKRRCWEHLSRHGVRMPALPAPAGSIAGYEELQAAIRSSGMHRLFLKLACGSGAAGVIAYQCQPATGAELAVTTLEMEERAGETVFYNSGRLRQYRDHAVIRRMVDWLCGEGAHVERWIAKERLDGKSFDVRQLVVNGSACHAVLRLSSSPITNLHLRNERRPMDEGMSASGVAEAVASTAEAALASFPASTVAGIDVLVRRGSGMTYAVDINPFGDLLYRVKYEGWNTYEWQMRQLLERKNHQ
ncbi:STM4014 family protein [Paenibacillus dendritiformis]|uniref:STM4014 family protein n=1 Tax=Paenibacillus dendritiformis TaxID=130049 RepID=UPI0036674BB7